MRNRLPKGHLYKRDKIWWVQWKYKTVPYAESLDTDNKDKAKTLLTTKMNQVKADIGNGTFLEIYSKDFVPNQPPNPANDILLSNAWTAYLKSVNRPDTGKATLEKYCYEFQHFVRWMDEHYPDIKTISAVNKTMAREFASYIGDMDSNNTFNKYVVLLRRVFKTLNDNLDIEINPWDKIQKRKVDTHSKRDFTKEEVELILSKAEGDIFTICLLGSQTGFRMKDCCLLEWREVDLENRIIKHAPFKTESRTGKVARMYIFDRLFEHLKALKKTADGVYVCPGMAALYLRDNSATVSRRVQAFFKSCGFELYHKEPDGRLVVDVGFHSFRHYFCSLAEENGVSEGVAKEIFGWGSTNMKKIYTHLSDELIIESMKKMEDKPKPETVTTSPALNNMSAKDLTKTIQALQQELKRRQKKS